MEEAAEHVRTLVVDAIKRQLVGDVPICTFIRGIRFIGNISNSSRRIRNRERQTLILLIIKIMRSILNLLVSAYSDKYWVCKVAEFIKSNHKM